MHFFKYKMIQNSILNVFFADNLRMAAVWATETDLQLRKEDGILILS